MKAEHTPGPWDWAERHYESNKFSIGADGKWLASIHHNGEQLVEKQRANIALIASAPELLSALTMVRDADDDCRRDGLKTIPSMARNRIDAAIAKAKGAA